MSSVCRSAPADESRRAVIVFVKRLCISFVGALNPSRRSGSANDPFSDRNCGGICFRASSIAALVFCDGGERGSFAISSYNLEPFAFRDQMVDFGWVERATMGGSLVCDGSGSGR